MAVPNGRFGRRAPLGADALWTLIQAMKDSDTMRLDQDAGELAGSPGCLTGDTTLCWDGPSGVRVGSRPESQSDGRASESQALRTEIAERQRAEAALRESERLFRDMMSRIKLISLMLDGRGRITYCNDYLLTLTGWRSEEVIGQSWFDLFIPSDIADLKDVFETLLKDLPDAWHHENEILTKAGRRRLIRWNNSVLRSASSEVIGTASIGEDITERKRAEEQLGESEERFRQMAERIDKVFWMCNKDMTQVLYVSPAYEQIWGRPCWTLYERPASFAEAAHPEDRDQLMATIAAKKQGRETEVQYRISRPDGSVRWILARSFPVRDEAGDFYRVAGVAEDITERKEAEAALRASEERLRLITETIDEAFWMADVAIETMVYVSPAYERIWGRSRESLRQNPKSFVEAIHGDDRQRVLAVLDSQRDGKRFEHEYRILRPDGTLRWILDRGFPLRNSEGKLTHYVGTAQDVTERKRLEAQFRQAQKMEAIGQLAGGVAHDFNNILAAMMMQAGLSLLSTDLSEDVRDGLQQIRSYAQRAANLTRQLLLFSRRQVMQPRLLDANEVVTSLAKMLQRIIGEDVRLQLHLHPTPLMTQADAGMLDQVVMNLSVNARDAMPGGGRLLIETSQRDLDEEFVRLHPDTQPGRYACLSVSDSGTGIPPEVLPHIFEPFFTTKESGKGTGLGLATVFGIVKQHQGCIEVANNPTCGARFDILLPLSEATSALPGCAAKSPKSIGGTETILLVEDEPAVRLLTRRTLERHGYRTLEAGNGEEAIAIWQEHRGEVALLLTDLVMPEGMTGQQLARRLQADRRHGQSWSHPTVVGRSGRVARLHWPNRRSRSCWLA
ncbi:putative Histidine kinase [Verrucomicrobia bacterium]|nr:putative Histidine kinase [Verrucomicrobiota bacterium]